MKDINIVYNMALEFYVALNKYVELSCNIVDLRVSEASTFVKLEREAYLDFTPNKKIKEWNENIKSTISPFLKNDIFHLFGMRPVFICFVNNLIIQNKLKTPQLLIDHLKTLPAIEVIKNAYNCYKTEIPFESTESVIFDEISRIAGVDEAKLFIYLKSNPEEFKARFLNILDSFYKMYFKPTERVIERILLKKLAEHSQIIENDSANFLSTIGLGDYTKVYKNYPIVVYASYYIDVGVSYIIQNEICHILYGIGMENRFNKKIMREKYKNLFKILSDETRREIVRLTSKRPWYNRELAEHFGLTTATLSYHLNMLLDLEILHFDPSDNYRYYYVANKEQLTRLFNITLADLLNE